MFSIRNGITFLIIGGAIAAMDWGFRNSSSTADSTWLEYNLGFVQFSAWIAGLIIAGLGLIFLIAGIIRRNRRRYSN